MEDTKELIIGECLQVLKREDVKENNKELINPIIQKLMTEIWPYIFISLLFVIISFLIILANFILLLRRKIIIKDT